LSYVDWDGLITVNPSAPALWDAFISVLRCTIDLYVAKFCNVSYHKGSRRIPKGTRICLARKRCLWCQLCFRNNDPIVNHKYKKCVSHRRYLTKQHHIQAEETLVESKNLGSFYKFINKHISSRSSIGTIVGTYYESGRKDF